MSHFIKPHKAFILAAGMGTRMKPYTDFCPKPMVQIANRSIIYRIIDKLVFEGVQEIVINLHYMAEILREHIEQYQFFLSDQISIKFHFSYEDSLLNTGGGIKKALHYFSGDDPFYVIAGDSLWLDGPNESALMRLCRSWEANSMDILTLLEPVQRMVLTQGIGDYDLLPNGRAIRSLDKRGSYMWTNIRLNRPSILEEIPEQAFSFLRVMDLAQDRGRLFAIEHDGEWHHISSAADVDTVDAYFKTHQHIRENCILRK